jgi:hypothetical protein
LSLFALLAAIFALCRDLVTWELGRIDFMEAEMADSPYNLVTPLVGPLGLVSWLRWPRPPGFAPGGGGAAAAAVATQNNQ